MNILFSILIVWFLLLPTSLRSDEGPTQEKGPLVLGQGEQRLLRVPGLERYSLGSPVVRVIPLGKGLGRTLEAHRETLLLKGVSPGHGDLWVWKRDGSSEFRTIRVEKRIQDQKNIPLERALGKLEEAEVIFSGSGVILRGTVSRMNEAARIHALIQGFPELIHDETEIAPSLLNEGEQRLQTWLKTSGLDKTLRVERIGGSLWVRGYVSLSRGIAALERQVRSLFPIVQTEFESLPDQAPTIYFRVFLLELKRTQFHQLGISWPGTAPGSFKITSAGIQNLLQLDLALQQLEGQGFAKILSNPELVVRAPGEAELFAGGELPIQQQSRYFSQVTWKNYGLTLRLKVTHSAGDRVRLEVYTEVSHLDSKIVQDQIPGFQSNRMKTQVDARLGRPLLLSGLLQQGMREEARGLPFLRKIPVLGLLFGSEDYLNERSELVAILYPHSSPPNDPMKKVEPYLPRGPIPVPRNWINPEEEKRLKDSQEYPWNALN